MNDSFKGCLEIISFKNSLQAAFLIINLLYFQLQPFSGVTVSCYMTACQKIFF